MAGEIDWYERRQELRSGQIFRCEDGSIVRLDQRVPGDGTKWFVEDYSDGRWFCEFSEIEPGDLSERLAAVYERPVEIITLTKAGAQQ